MKDKIKIKINHSEDTDSKIPMPLGSPGPESKLFKVELIFKLFLT